MKNTGLRGRCECKDGFTGSTCDQCISGHFGPQCKGASRLFLMHTRLERGLMIACDESCSICDDGLNGTGQCIGASSTPLKGNEIRPWQIFTHVRLQLCTWILYRFWCVYMRCGIHHKLNCRFSTPKMLRMRSGLLQGFKGELSG